MPIKQRLRFLLLPVLAPLFLIGWVLSFVGDRGEINQTRKITVDKTPKTNEDTVQMGLMAEITEDPIEAQ